MLVLHKQTLSTKASRKYLIALRHYYILLLKPILGKPVTLLLFILLFLILVSDLVTACSVETQLKQD